jgi:hypothetical protein
MNQFTHLSTGGTSSAGIVGLFVFTIDVRSKSPRQSDSCPTYGPVEELGMSYVVILNGADKSAFGIVVTEYIFEKQNK